MKLIELHILQSFPVTCLNRDDLNAPKSAIFGGAQRARVSSQSWKRAIRKLAAEEQKPYFGGQRSHHLSISLAKAIDQKEKPSERGLKVAAAVADVLGKTDEKYTDGHKTSVSLYFSPGEIEGIATAINKNINEIADAIKQEEESRAKKEDNGKEKKPKGSPLQKIIRGKLKGAIQSAVPKDLADIAIFGRMVASDHTLQIEGAGLFSHALSTHQMANEIDFFSAVDDLKPEESEGAGHIGTLEFNSACYYRYVGLNLDLLWDEEHLHALDSQGRQTVLDTFLRSALLAVPGARKNSMFGHNPPAFVKGIVRRGQPLSLVNAFEEPIRSHGGYIKPSIEKFNAHYTTLKTTYNLEAPCEVSIPDKDLKTFCEEITKEALKK